MNSPGDPLRCDDDSDKNSKMYYTTFLVVSASIIPYVHYHCWWSRLLCHRPWEVADTQPPYSHSSSQRKEGHGARSLHVRTEIRNDTGHFHGHAIAKAQPQGHPRCGTAEQCHLHSRWLPALLETQHAVLADTWQAICRSGSVRRRLGPSLRAGSLSLPLECKLSQYNQLNVREK